ncbi:MAG: hypothetical protein AAF926_06595 [Pseudomonadota bacterium]
MSLSNYSELTATIASVLNRTDLTDTIPTWVALAESVFNRRLRTREMEAYAAIPANDGQFSLPSDFLVMRAIQISGTTTTLTAVSDDFIAGLPSQVGTPLYYSIQGGYVLLYPAPADGTNVEMRYYQRIPALTKSNTTNWLLTKNPDAYLYTALINSAPFLHDDERLVTWARLSGEAIDGINDLAMEAVEGGRPQMISDTVRHF